jgi:hypothetical protein
MTSLYCGCKYTRINADVMYFTNAANIIHIGCWWKIQEERNHWENLDVNGRILDWILEEEDGVVGTGFISLRIGTRRRLF